MEDRSYAIDGQINMTEEEFVEYLRTTFEMWMDDPYRYSASPEGIIQWKFTGQQLLKFLVTHDEVAETAKRFDPLYITNSDCNRTPTSHRMYDTFGRQVQRSRNIYGFKTVMGCSSTNLFPMSVIDVTEMLKEGIEPKLVFNALLLKDRGNISTQFMRADEEIYDVAEWRDTIRQLRIEEGDTLEKRPTDILENVEKLLDEHDDKDKLSFKRVLSVSDAQGRNVWDTFLNAQTLTMQASFEDYQRHLRELEGLNNNETGWAIPNFLIARVRNNAGYDPNITEWILDVIHDLVKDDEIISGKSPFLSNMKHKQHESFESWFLLMFTALTEYLNPDLKNKKKSEQKLTNKSFVTDMINNGANPSNRQTAAWNQLSKNPNAMKKLKFYRSVLNAVSKDPQWEEYQRVLKDRIRERPEYDVTNITDLKIKSHDSAAIVLRLIDYISREVFTSRSDSLKRQVEAGKRYAETLISFLKNDQKLKPFIQSNGKKPLSARSVSRLDHFYVPAAEETIKRMKSDASNFDKDEAYYDLKRLLRDDSTVTFNGDTFEDFDIYDIKYGNTLIETTVNFVELTGLSICHVDHLSPNSIDNLFLHLNEYNNYIQDKVNIVDDSDQWTKDLIERITELAKEEEERLMNKQDETDFGEIYAAINSIRKRLCNTIALCKASLEWHKTKKALYGDS